mmetsp:Transcript_141181/g.451278  ORF Transcript_141181/g.451278 Transcript_141181/m.451278 type:complete len:307 (-) Transcript_141181:186-1106(-)
MSLSCCVTSGSWSEDSRKASLARSPAPPPLRRWSPSRRAGARSEPGGPPSPLSTSATAAAPSSASNPGTADASAAAASAAMSKTPAAAAVAGRVAAGAVASALAGGSAAEAAAASAARRSASSSSSRAFIRACSSSTRQTADGGTAGPAPASTPAAVDVRALRRCASVSKSSSSNGAGPAGPSPSLVDLATRLPALELLGESTLGEAGKCQALMTSSTMSVRPYLLCRGLSSTCLWLWEASSSASPATAATPKAPPGPTPEVDAQAAPQEAELLPPPSAAAREKPGAEADTSLRATELPRTPPATA